MTVRAPAVSVVIPVYGTRRWLPACIESVLASTLQDIEVICVDDCSQDGSADVLAEFARNDSRVTVVALGENSGQGVARNVGLELAVGRYVYFLDSDDMVEPEALAELVSIADERSLDGVLFDSRAVFDTPELEVRHASYLGMRQGSYPSGVCSGAELFSSFVSQGEWTCYVQRQLWRRGHLTGEKVSFPEWPSHEDEAFAFEALLAARRVSYVRRPYFVRRFREGSVMTSGPSMRDFLSYFMCYCHMVRFVHDRGLGCDAVWRDLARIHEKLVRIHALLLGGGEDPLPAFEGTDLLDSYLLFAQSQKAHLFYEKLSDGVVEAARSVARLYVYGAGVLATNTIDELALRGIAVDGVMVTSLEGNPGVLRGHRVLEFEGLAPDADALVLVAATDGYAAQIGKLLDDRGWRHVWCKD